MFFFLFTVSTDAVSSAPSRERRIETTTPMPYVKTIVLYCSNYTSFLDSFEINNARITYYVVTFKIINDDVNILVKVITKQMNEKMFLEFSEACSYIEYGELTCLNRALYENLKDSNHFLKIFFRRCSRQELNINCYSSERYLNEKVLNEARKRYRRITFAAEENEELVLEASEVNLEDVANYVKACEKDIDCRDRKRYKKLDNWISYWKGVFDKCLMDDLVMECDNVGSYLNRSKLESVKDAYRKIGFLSFDGGKLFMLESSQATLYMIKKWKQTCPTILIANCTTFSKHFGNNFDTTVNRYNSIVFLIKNIDEDIKVEKESRSLDNSFVKEYEWACHDPLFTNTPCNKRFETFKNIETYNILLKYFFEACSQHEMIINCKNSKRYLNGTMIRDSKKKFQRFVFAQNEKIPVVMNVDDVTLDDVLFYDKKCDVHFPCKDRNKYRKYKNWKSDWKDLFEKCLKPNITLHCDDVENYLNPAKLKAIKDGYRKIQFVPLESEKNLVLNASRVNLDVIKKWKKNCVK